VIEKGFSPLICPVLDRAKTKGAILYTKNTVSGQPIKKTHAVTILFVYGKKRAFFNVLLIL